MIFSVDGLRPPVRALYNDLVKFLDEEVYPIEKEIMAERPEEVRWTVNPLMNELKVSNQQNCRKSSVTECIFDYIVLYFECRFNKNSLLQSCFFAFFPATWHKKLRCRNTWYATGDTQQAIRNTRAITKILNFYAPLRSNRKGIIIEYYVEPADFANNTKYNTIVETSMG